MSSSSHCFHMLTPDMQTLHHSDHHRAPGIWLQSNWTRFHLRLGNISGGILCNPRRNSICPSNSLHIQEESCWRFEHTHDVYSESWRRSYGSQYRSPVSLHCNHPFTSVAQGFPEKEPIGQVGSYFPCSPFKLTRTCRLDNLRSCRDNAGEFACDVHCLEVPAKATRNR